MTSVTALASAFYKAFPGTEHLIVEELETCGCGQKFNLYAGSSAFDGVKILDRHRKVNEALADEIAKLHAIVLKLWTVEDWEKKKSTIPEALLTTDFLKGESLTASE